MEGPKVILFWLRTYLPTLLPRTGLPKDGDGCAPHINFSGIDDEEGGVQPRHAAGVRGLSGGMAGRYD